MADALNIFTHNAQTLQLDRIGIIKHFVIGSHVHVWSKHEKVRHPGHVQWWVGTLSLELRKDRGKTVEGRTAISIAREGNDEGTFLTGSRWRNDEQGNDRKACESYAMRA
jgi:hypothetical protein